MGRFSADQADNYGGNGGHGFFSLKNDKDTAKVRFMYGSGADIEGFAVHAIELDGKKRYVNCIREYNEPVDKCPFCAAKKPQYAKLFVPVYDIADQQVKIWERGKKFFGEITSICSRYSSADSPLVSQVFEIERRGKAGDQGTTYGIFPIGQPDNTQFEDLPELQDVLGGLVLDKNADELDYFLDTGRFPSEGGNGSDEPVTRRGSDRDEYRRGGSEDRRTPSRRGDSF